jgi:hypothetical protein
MARFLHGPCTFLEWSPYVRISHTLLALLIFLGPGASAVASDLSYTFMDFQVLNNRVDAVGVQSPVEGQTVTVHARSGDGMAVAGAAAMGSRLYFIGHFRTSVIDVDGLVQSPLGQAQVDGRFDLVQTSLGIGIRHELSRNLDAIAELSYDSTDYDFGSFAGESFDVRERGPGGRLGMRWQPRPAVELHAAARYSAVARPLLTERELDPDITGNVGIRWYFFQDLGAGLDYEGGYVRTLTLSLRFGFGNLPW